MYQLLPIEGFIDSIEPRPAKRDRTSSSVVDSGTSRKMIVFRSTVILGRINSRFASTMTFPESFTASITSAMVTVGTEG